MPTVARQPTTPAARKAATPAPRKSVTPAARKTVATATRTPATPAARRTATPAARKSAAPAARKAAPAIPAGRRARRAAVGRPPAATLCVDIGGSAVKGGTVDLTGALIAEAIRVPTTYPCSPEALVETIGVIARQSPPATRVSLGFPGMVRAGVVLSAPHFITRKGPGTKVDPQMKAAWDRFPLAEHVAAALGLPCRLGNDADVQGLAAIEGTGLELVITLGTGFGSAVFLDGELGPHLELSHHPLSKGKSYNEVVGEAARVKLGKSKWSKHVGEAIDAAQALVFFDRLYLGGGNAAKLAKSVAARGTVVPNADGILGGAKLWSLTRMP